MDSAMISLRIAAALRTAGNALLEILRCIAILAVIRIILAMGNACLELL